MFIDETQAQKRNDQSSSVLPYYSRRGGSATRITSPGDRQDIYVRFQEAQVAADGEISNLCGV